MNFYKSKFDEEIKSINRTMTNNSFQLEQVQSLIRNKISNFDKIKPASTEICPICLRLSWLRNINDWY